MSRVADASMELEGARPGLALGWVVVLLALLVGLTFLASLFVGHGSLADATLGQTFLVMRSQRVAVAFLSGAALSVSGAIVQSLFRNPLASPFILGTTSGATLGGQASLLVATAVAGHGATSWLAPEMALPFGCILGAIGSLLILLLVTSMRSSPLTLVLAGFVLSTLFASFGTLLETLVLESAELWRAMQIFTNGSVSGAGTKQVVLALLLVLGGCVPALLQADSLDVLLSGEEEAQSLGVDVRRVRLWCVVWVAVITAGAVAVGGSVAFVGLIVPHALRPFVGVTHRRLLPAAFVAGGCFLVWCDMICRALPMRSEMPLSVITSLIGAPIFLRMLAGLEREGHHG